MAVRTVMTSAEQTWDSCSCAVADRRCTVYTRHSLHTVHCCCCCLQQCSVRRSRTGRLAVIVCTPTRRCHRYNCPALATYRVYVTDVRVTSLTGLRREVPAPQWPACGWFDMSFKRKYKTGKEITAEFDSQIRGNSNWSYIRLPYAFML